MQLIIAKRGVDYAQLAKIPTWAHVHAIIVLLKVFILQAELEREL